MTRTLVYLILAIVAAGSIGILVARDPGYVLVVYGSYSMQTSLWVLLALVALSTGLAYVTVRITRGLLRTTEVFGGWRQQRKDQKSRSLTRRGIALLTAGEYAKAEKLLVSGAGEGSEAGTNLLAAARAANAQDQGERREALLRRAIEADQELEGPARIAAAEMAAERGEWQRCLDCLADARSTDLVLRLKQRAMLALQDWEGLSALMPALRRSGENLDEFEKRVAMERLSAPNMTDEGRKVIYGRLPDSVKRDEGVILKYIDGMTDESKAESVLRQGIKQTGSPALLLAYAELGSVTLAKRIKRAESWAKDGESYAVHLALAMMYRAAGETAKATDTCRRSLDIAESAEGQKLMALLLADAGDLAGSNEYFKRLLLPSTSQLTR
ncbi:MAG: hypothetical protein O2868_06760 [Proteobacteria bacterium]|jgi:HemY protein|nr:hypothetical protein [Pseudomonadota bacterium]